VAVEAWIDLDARGARAGTHDRISVIIRASVTEPFQSAPQRRRPSWTTEMLVVACVLIIFVAFVSPTLNQPLIERHALRQTQTAYPARIFHEDGIDLMHPKLPVFGEPFEAPFEFPLFQAAASLVMDAGVSDDMSMRTTALACFVITALLLFGLVRHVAGPVSGVAALFAFVVTPLSLSWARASLMEYMATAGAVGFTWATISWRERPRTLPAALALVAGLVGMLVKPTTAVFWFAPALLYHPRTHQRRRGRGLGVTALLVALPLGAAVLWTRHADAIKAASPTTAWLTSSELRGWYLGTLAQRFDPHTWAVMSARLSVVVGLSGVLLVVSALATWRSPQRAFWLGIWVSAIAPALVFTNQYVAHDYYVVAVSPAFAALIGLGFGSIERALPVRTALTSVIAAALVLFVTFGAGRSYWQPIFDGDDGSGVVPLARQIDAHTADGDLIGVAGLDWSPAVLYYARRWGQMVVPQTGWSVAYDLMHAQRYRYFLHADPGHGDLAQLDRWRFVGALDRNLYALADEPKDLSGALAVTTDQRPVYSTSTKGPFSMKCGRSKSVHVGPQGAWVEFAPTRSWAQVVVSDALAALPVRRALYVAPDLSSNGGRLTIGCRGVDSIQILGVRDGAGPAAGWTVPRLSRGSSRGRSQGANSPR
jgi:hypothetical protein